MQIDFGSERASYGEIRKKRLIVPGIRWKEDFCAQTGGCDGLGGVLFLVAVTQAVLAQAAPGEPRNTPAY